MALRDLLDWLPCGGVMRGSSGGPRGHVHPLAGRIVAALPGLSQYLCVPDGRVEYRVEVPVESREEIEDFVKERIWRPALGWQGQVAQPFRSNGVSVAPHPSMCELGRVCDPVTRFRFQSPGRILGEEIVQLDRALGDGGIGHSQTGFPSPPDFDAFRWRLLRSWRMVATARGMMPPPSFATKPQPHIPSGMVITGNVGVQAAHAFGDGRI